MSPRNPADPPVADLLHNRGVSAHARSLAWIKSFQHNLNAVSVTDLEHENDQLRYRYRLVQRPQGFIELRRLRLPKQRNRIEWWQVGLNGSPHPVEIDLELVVNQHISHSCDLPAGDGRIIGIPRLRMTPLRMTES